MIPSVGKPKIQYKDHSTVSFESLDFYLTLAKKIIAKNGGNTSNNLTKNMLKDEDAISFVANAIMMGDWRWKENKEDNNYKTLYSYRNQCGIWAIKTYITKYYRSQNSPKKKQTYSLNFINNDDGSEISDVIPDINAKDPLDILIKEENKSSLKGLINNILASDLLSNKQKEYIRLYYMENLTLEKIGNLHGVTREAIRQSIKVSLEKIRNLV